MTEEQKALLEMIAKQLGGVVEYKTYCDLKTTHEKVVITYDVKQRRANQVPSRYNEIST